jgi:hypothetical protein
MRIKNVIVYGGVSLFVFSLIAPALREAMTCDETEHTSAVLAANSREPFELPHIDPAFRTLDILPDVTAPSVTGGNLVDQTHWIDVYIGPRNL